MNLFVDTNVIVYLVDRSDERKREIARALLRDDSVRVNVSPQVLGELFVTLRRKMSGVLSDAQIEEHVQSFVPRCNVSLDSDLVVRALGTSRRHQLSYWDALIIESAREVGCPRLATEDLSHGSVIRDVEIWNPFADVA